MVLQAMDAAHVSLVALLLRKDGFEEYKCEKNMTLGMNLETLSKVLKCAGNEDTVTIKTHQEKDSVGFIFESKNKVSDFELKTLDIDSQVLSIPEVDHKSILKMPAVEFQKIMSNLSAWGDTVMISTSSKGVKFSVNGEIGRGNISIKPNSVDSETVELDITEDVSQTFALKKLVSFTKATPLSTSVTLSMSDELPLVLEYSLDDFGHLRYFLAPKIDDSDD